MTADTLSVRVSREPIREKGRINLWPEGGDVKRKGQRKENW
jgi:hypothetical protein